jgi:PAS domain S-box-containing protein
MNDLPVGKFLPEQDFACRWWEKLFDASDDAQILCRSDGIALRINAKAARTFQLRPDTDEGGFSIFTILPSTAKRRLARILQLRPSPAEMLHSVTVLRDGSPHLLMDLEVASLAGGFSLVVFKDASRRLRLETHVQRLITAIDATPDVFLVTDADLRITFVNPAFQTVTGYSLEEVLGRSDEFLRAPFEQEKVNAYRDLVSRGLEWIGELVNLRRSGETYHVESTISPISDIAGRFVGYVVCERDITVRKHLEDALRRERDFVRSILHSLDGAIYSLDREFHLTHANDGWRQLPAEHGGIRWNSAPEMGRSLLDFVPDATRRAELQFAFYEAMSTGRAQDNHFHAPDGHYWLMKISPWIDGREVRGLICSITDQTRYHELQNQLFQSQKMEIIGTLAAGVAHDFNNLLQVIRGHTSLVLMQAEADSPLRKGLERIDMAAVRAAEITKQLLSFSRASEERRIVLDLNKVIKEANLLARQTLRGNVVVELRPEAKPVRVKMDPTKASQALINLCVNGQDAMPEGGSLTLTNTAMELPADLATRHHLHAGAPFVRCSVKDSGCGISPDVLPRIFEPFFTTKVKGKGTGLGLAIVQRVAEEAGGFIEVESVLQQGTTFHLYLPLVEEQLTPVTAPSRKPLARCKGRVLVVDDVDLLRDFTQNFLQMTGLTVLVAGNGDQALKMLEESPEPVDLVFTDYNMPGMNGLKLIEQIAARWPKIKFVLASGFLDEQTRTRIEQCNATILAKPYDMRTASEIVMKILEAA